MWRLNSPIHPLGFTAKLPYIVEENGESQDLLTWLPKRRSDIIITRYWDNSQHPAALCRRMTQYVQFLSLVRYIVSKNYSFPNFPYLGGLTCLFCYNLNMKTVKLLISTYDVFPLMTCKCCILRVNVFFAELTTFEACPLYYSYLLQVSRYDWVRHYKEQRKVAQVSI
jgi:hypothetical protein